jgi:DNA-binding IclR family transcriptional regulator
MAFIRDHIDSLEQLEVLLHLRARADREWTPAELNAELKSTPASVTRRLESLERRGLAARTGADGFSFASADAATVDQLAACYASRRVAVIEAIFSGEALP